MKNILTLFSLSILLLFVAGCSKSDSGQMDSANVSEGKAGSTARIVIKGSYIYAVDNNSLKVIDISTPNDPKYIRTVTIDEGIETIYPFKDYLFIGSNIGMYVYGLTDPTNPNKLSQFQHVTACDPVIANDTLAFVTLRNNEQCNRWVDTREIDVINIENITSPYMEKIYYTNSYPYGLDMLDTLLFVCHGPDGVMVYDINKMLSGNAAEVSSIGGLNAFDAIIWQNKLFVIGESGFYQYDYSDIHNITLISSILTHQ